MIFPLNFPAPTLPLSRGVLLLVVLASLSLFILPTSSSGVNNKVDPELRKKIESAPSGTLWNVILLFKNDQFKSILGSVQNRTGDERHLKSYELMTKLEKYAEETQGKAIAGIKNFQNSHSLDTLKYESYWINTALALLNAPKDLIYLLGGTGKPEFENITAIIEDGLIGKEEPVEKADPSPPEEAEPPYQKQPLYTPMKETWGLDKINAPAWWKDLYNGTGVIVGHIDTGADIRHPSLLVNWLGKGPGWWDPSFGRGLVENTFPFEQDKLFSHGTHTLGIMVGRGRGPRNRNATPDDMDFFGVGVAPGARWISCLGCRMTFFWAPCEYHHLFACALFMACPSPTDFCQYSPDVVSLSFGIPQSQWLRSTTTHFPFQDMIAAFLAAGILPVWSVGNNGESGCVTVQDPENKDIISVGNVNRNDQLHKTSSMGPPYWRYPELETGFNPRQIYKPDFVAPGTQIWSTVYAGRPPYYKYEYKTGTSMATPHVAGAIALLLSRNKGLSFDKIHEVLSTFTVKNDELTSSNPSELCLGIEDRITPNHKFGWGRLWLPNPGDDRLTAILGPPERPTRRMPPPPDYSDLADDSTPPSVRPSMLGLILIASIAFLMNTMMEI